MKSSHIIAILATAQAALASPHFLQSRGEHEGIQCATPQTCVNWYDTGSAQCSSGYTRYHKEVDGFPPGSYCEKDCTSQEQTNCNADRCKYSEKQCNQYPLNAGLCADAIRWCDGPVAMPKSICTSENMGVEVTYSPDESLCIPPGKTATSRKASPYSLGTGDNFNAAIYDPSVAGYKEMTCRGSTYSNAKFLAQEAEKATEGCTTTLDDDQGNSGYGGLNIKCSTPKDKWMDVQNLLSQACSESPSFNGNKVYFQSLGFSGQPK